MKLNKQFLNSLRFKQRKNGKFIRIDFSNAGREVDIFSDVEKDIIKNFKGYDPSRKTMSISKKAIAYDSRLAKHFGTIINPKTLNKIERSFFSYSIDYKYIGMDIDKAIILAKTLKDFKSLKALEFIKLQK